MEPDCRAFARNARKALSDKTLQASLRSAAGNLAGQRAAAVEAFPEFEPARERASGIKRGVLANLDTHLSRFIGEASSRGAVVHVARDAAQARGIVARIAREEGVSLAVRSKSPAADEISLDDALREAGVEIVDPAPGESAPPRVKFLAAGMGVSGAAFLVADTGSVVHVTNDGNDRMAAALPRVHLAVAGIEEIIPRMADLPAFLRLLPRSAAGRTLASRVSILTGAKREGETEGPERQHILLIDCGRSAILEGKYREMLKCIRCGACSNVCPVYRNVGAIPYGWVYSGPMGAVLTPLLVGLAEAAPLPDASTLCGACAEVCPVKIPLPDFLLELRADVREQGLKAPGEIAGMKMLAALMKRAGLLEVVERLLGGISLLLSKGNPMSGLPYPFAGWTEQRDFPAVARQPFRKLWKIRRGARG
jgi:L-lactate dehydrogenase complex protein LldF